MMRSGLILPSSSTARGLGGPSALSSPLGLQGLLLVQDHPSFVSSNHLCAPGVNDSLSGTSPGQIRSYIPCAREKSAPLDCRREQHYRLVHTQLKTRVLW